MRKALLSGWTLPLCIALLIGGGLSLFASSSPDGLERVAADHGFLDRATAYFQALLPDYSLPGLENQTLANALAGIIGTLAVFGLLYGIGWIISRNTKPEKT